MIPNRARDLEFWHLPVEVQTYGAVRMASVGVGRLADFLYHHTMEAW